MQLRNTIKALINICNNTVVTQYYVMTNAEMGNNTCECTIQEHTEVIVSDAFKTNNNVLQKYT